MKKLATRITTTILVLLTFTAGVNAQDNKDNDSGKDKGVSPMSLCEVLRVCDPDLKG
jgi:hypothetical protein